MTFAASPTFAEICNMFKQYRCVVVFVVSTTPTLDGSIEVRFASGTFSGSKVPKVTKFPNNSKIPKGNAGTGVCPVVLVRSQSHQTDIKKATTTIKSVSFAPIRPEKKEKQAVVEKEGGVAVANNDGHRKAYRKKAQAIRDLCRLLKFSIPGFTEGKNPKKLAKKKTQPPPPADIFLGIWVTAVRRWWRTPNKIVVGKTDDGGSINIPGVLMDHVKQCVKVCHHPAAQVYSMYFFLSL